MKGFKGFNKDLKCTPKEGIEFQYEVGKTYTTATASLCHTGFHFCESPLDTLRYYSPALGSRYAEVEASQVSDEQNIDTKRVSKSLNISAEIYLPALLGAGMKFILGKVDFEHAQETASGRRGTAAASGYGGMAAASGYGGTAAASGRRGTAAASGDGGMAAASGYGGTAAASGRRGTAAASGDGGTAAASGDGGTAAASGDGGTAAASGDGGTAAASGDGGTAAASGYGGMAAASGRRGTAAASGYGGMAAASGDGGTAAASGDGGMAAASGDGGTAAASGDESCAIASGIEGKAKGALGCWITLAEWKFTDSKWHRIDMQTKKVDGTNIKPDTLYILQAGNFVEVSGE